MKFNGRKIQNTFDILDCIEELKEELSDDTSEYRTTNIENLESLRDDAWTKDFKQQLIRIENTNKKLDEAKQITDEEEKKKETQKIRLELKNLVDSKNRMLEQRLPNILGKIDNAIKRVRTEIKTSDVDETRRKELEELLEQYTKKKEEIKNEWKQ